MDSPTSITDQTPKEKPIVITSSGNKKPSFKFSFVNPKILGAITVLLLLVGGVGTGVYLIQTPPETTSQASLPGVDLNFKPAEVQTNVGSEFSIDVFANANDNQINATDLTFKYNPEVLDLKSITPGQFLPRILINPDIQPGTATISLGTDGNSGVSGSGIIASLIFEAKTDSPEPNQITFDPETTEIKVLNRGDGSSDILGKVDVIISSSEISEQPTQASEDTSTPPAASSSATLFDFNNDGLTNSIDLSIMYAAWGNPDSETQQKTDLNNDSIVNGMDYSVFLPQLRR